MIKTNARRVLIVLTQKGVMRARVLMGLPETDFSARVSTVNKSYFCKHDRCKTGTSNSYVTMHANQYSEFTSSTARQL